MKHYVISGSRFVLPPETKAIESKLAIYRVPRWRMKHLRGVLVSGQTQESSSVHGVISGAGERFSGGAVGRNRPDEGWRVGEGVECAHGRCAMVNVDHVVIIGGSGGVVCILRA